MNVVRGHQDTRIKFSARMTAINFLVSTIVAFVIPIILYTTSERAELNIIWGPAIPYTLGTVLTAAFLFFDSLFPWCCGCWFGEKETVVFDPDNHSARLVWRSGEVVDLDQEKEEGTEMEQEETGV